MKKIRCHQTKSSLLMAVALGALLSILITVCGVLLTASMIHRDTWGEDAENTASFVVWIVASFVGAVLSGALHKDKFWLAILLNALVYFLILLAVNILLFDGEFGAIGQGILAILIGAVPALLICRPKHSRSKVKIPYRR